MKLPIVACLALLCTSTAALGVIHAKEIRYPVGGVTFVGYLAWDDEVQGQRPGVIVIHEWWGNDDYSRRRAEQLAQHGYVGFAIDMYGNGRTTQDPKQAEQLSSQVRKDPQQAKARLAAALEALKKQPQVDPERIAAIGYCFGGSMALNMARWGMDVDAVVSFHGDLSDPDPKRDAEIRPRILVLTGADDQWVPQQAIESFKQEMRRARADYEVVVYPGAQHSFTNPDADKHNIPNVKYNAEADRQSWEEMQRFLTEVFGN